MTSLPILLIPGLNCTAAVFGGLLPALWQFGSVTVADHRRGDTVTAIATAILAEAPPRFALAGFSMGGYIALDIMRQAPERVARLALIDTGAGTDVPEQRENRLRQIALAKAGRLDSVADATFATNVHPDNANDAALRSVFVQMALETGPDIYVAQQHAIMNRAESHAILGQITCPTSILIGEADQVTPIQLSRKMRDSIPNANLMLIEGAGHMAPLEQPQAVAAALSQWLSEPPLGRQTPTFA